MNVATTTDLPPALALLAQHGTLDLVAVHVARRITTLLGTTDERDLLLCALAVRAPLHGHVALDLDHVTDLLAGEELAQLRGDQAAELRASLQAVQERVRTGGVDARLVGPPPPRDATTTPDIARPLVVVDQLVWTRRWWDLEQRVLHAVGDRLAAPPDDVPSARLDAALDQVLVSGQDAQRAAIRSSTRRRLTVLAGGPGTGKTWTVARLLAVHATISTGRPPTVALAAPTGKAAARLRDGVHRAVTGGDLAGPMADAVAAMVAATGTTIHALLGMRPGRAPRHGPGNPLPHDIVVVDEASMVSLPLLDALVAALAPTTCLVLVGDPDQLASVEAGSVLGDLVGALAATNHPALATLTRVHRFAADSGIAGLATAIRDGDVEAALHTLATSPDVDWYHGLDSAADSIRAQLVDQAQALVRSARIGEVATATAALGDVVVLAAHRRGPTGVEVLNDLVESWLAQADIGWRPWDDRQVGRPVLVTANDRLLGVHNGDVGVHVRGPDGTIRVAFDLEGDQGPVTISPDRMPDHDRVHAMTIHKSQGSQWRHVVVVLPDHETPFVSRQLLYTAATRAQSRITVVGAPQVVRAAITTLTPRATGLDAALRGRLG